MASQPSCLCWVASLGLGILSASAQENTTPSAPAAHTPAALAPARSVPAPAAPAAVSPTPSRPVSTEIAAALAAAMPKYAPPPPAAPVAGGGGAGQLPKNGILRLPGYIVRSTRIRSFSERELYTPQGLRQLAVKRYLTEFDYGVLNRFTLPLYGRSPEARAMQLFDADELKQNNAEIKDLMKLEQIH